MNFNKTHTPNTSRSYNSRYLNSKFEFSLKCFLEKFGSIIEIQDDEFRKSATNFKLIKNENFI